MRKSTALPKAIRSAIDGRLSMLEDRLSALQFNNSVELDMLVRIIAGQYDLGPGYLRKLRSDSMKNVKQTSGRVSLANAVKESDEAECGAYVLFSYLYPTFAYESDAQRRIRLAACNGQIAAELLAPKR